jgi:hypothetical protein
MGCSWEQQMAVRLVIQMVYAKVLLKGFYWVDWLVGELDHVLVAYLDCVLVASMGTQMVLMLVVL